MTRKTAPSDSQAQLEADLLRDAVDLRRTLHVHAETAFEEEQTARIVVEHLARHGLEPEADDVAGHGLLFRIDGQGDGARVMLEADLDALPLKEDTGKEHASSNDGKHHACGHDGHMAMLAGAMVWLAKNRDRFGGTVYALFQPAEETGQGAERVMMDPRIRDLDLDVVFGIHNLPGYPLGQIIIRGGPMASASVGMHFRFLGETSHAASPHKGKSAVAAVSQLALRAPGVPTDVLPYGRAALVTPIHLDAGRIAYGTTAGSGSARFTVRAADDDDLAAVRERLEQEARGIAQAHGLELQVEQVEPFPATMNDPACVDMVEETARVLGLKVSHPEGALPWSEDFGHFNARWPGALICLGSGEEQPELHRPDYDFPDDLLHHGIDLWVTLITQVVTTERAERAGQEAEA